MKHLRIINFAISCLIFLNSLGVYSQNIKTEKRIEGDTVYIDFINPFFAPIEFKVAIKEDYRKTFFTDETIILQARDTIYGAMKYLKSIERDSIKDYREYYSISGHFGHKESIAVDKDFRYMLPFPKGKAYKIMQGNNGSFSHNRPQSFYAIDFDMKIGDTITAARAGIVVFTMKDSQEYGGTKEFIGKANKVMVMHSDGTYALYLHLKFNEVFVEEGTEVKAGDPLGLVGLTGFTTKPHLHFVVQREREISIPIRYRTIRGKTLKENKIYRH